VATTVLLRRPVAQDLDALVMIFAEPAVAPWWPRYDRERIEREFVVGDDEDTTVYVIEVGGKVAGIIQSWEETDPEYRHAGIDVGIATAWHGQGVATAAIRALARRLVVEVGHHHLTIDPAVANARAIACYRKIGYHEVGVLRSNEMSADGTFRDTLLMDMLAGDLILDGPIA